MLCIAQVFRWLLLVTFAVHRCTALSCYSCTGEDCVKVSSAGKVLTCGVDLQSCYTRYSGYLPSERGCLATGAECFDPECTSCAEDNCNDLSRSDHACVSCSSVTDPQCLTGPAEVATERCAAASVDVSDAQCYTRVIGSVTERGCVTSQQDLDSCAAEKCETCAGNGCNREEYPVGRTKCVVCEGVACVGKITTDYCDNPDDYCVTVLRSDGTSSKGCEGAMVAADQQYCATANGRCSFCSKSGCNVEPVDMSAARNCYACDGTDCFQGSLLYTTCHAADDDCYTRFQGYNPIERGCFSTLDDTKKGPCEDNEVAECRLCTGELCNLQSREDHRCIYCSSVFDVQCINAPDANTRTVECPAPTTEVTDDAQCYTKAVGTVTERGCLSAPDDLQQCTEGSCETCAIADSGVPCNGALFPANRRQCTIGSTAAQYCPDPDDDCVQMLQNEARKRTCRSSMTAAEVTFCQTNSNRCSFCSTDNCNAATVAFDYIECAVCNSQQDARCATNPEAIETTAHCAVCAVSVSTDLTGTSITRRGCLSTLPADHQQQCAAATTTSSILCNQCSANLCNRQNFPASRLQCYQCTNPPCSSHAALTLAYCQRYVADDSCVAQLDTTGQLVALGCHSALSVAEVASCTANADRCATCTTNQCNDPALILATASCIQCRSSANAQCMGRAGELDGTPCNDPVNSQCYTRYEAGVTERGCLSDLSLADRTRCAAGDGCVACDGKRTKCNSAEYPVAQLTCYQCDSTADATCANGQSGEAAYCATYDNANQCYTTVSTDGRTVRGCSSAPRETICTGAAKCEVCLFRGCNGKASDSVGYTTSSVQTTTPEPTGAAIAYGPTVAITFAAFLLVTAVAPNGRQ